MYQNYIRLRVKGEYNLLKHLLLSVRNVIIKHMSAGFTENGMIFAIKSIICYPFSCGIFVAVCNIPMGYIHTLVQVQSRHTHSKPLRV